MLQPDRLASMKQNATAAGTGPRWGSLQVTLQTPCFKGVVPPGRRGRELERGGIKREEIDREGKGKREERGRDGGGRKREGSWNRAADWIRPALSLSVRLPVCLILCRSVCACSDAAIGQRWSRGHRSMVSAR